MCKERERPAEISVRATKLHYYTQLVLFVFLAQVSAKALISARKTKRNSKEYLVPNEADVDVAFGGASLHFTDIVKGNPMLTEKFNEILNENIQQVLVDVKPVIVEMLGKVILRLVSGVFDTFPLNELFA